MINTASEYQVVYTMQYYNDFTSIAEHYLNQFKDKNLIENLKNHVIANEEILKTFPRSFPSFKSSKPLKHEYRSFRALNYKVFFYIDEESKTIYMERILYSGMDLDNKAI